MTMDQVVVLPTQLSRDAVALERLIDDVVARHQRGEIRAGWLFYFDRQGIPHFAAANTTLGDEAYGLALMQERLMRLLGSQP